MDWHLNHELIRTGVIVLLAAIVIFVILRGLVRAKTAERDDEQEERPDDADQPPLTAWARVVGRQFYRRTWFVTFEVESGERMTLPYYAQPLPEICEEGTLTIRNGQCVGFERG